MKLEPEEKEKFTILKSDDPRSQILYHEMQFGNYMFFSDTLGISKESKQTKDDQFWIMEFYGSCANVGSSAWVVLTSPSEEMTCLTYKLDFKNTNNTTEYEALLLGIMTTKQKGFKLLKAQGDVELVVRQVKNQYAVKNSRMRGYCNKVWDEMRFWMISQLH